MNASPSTTTGHRAFVTALLAAAVLTAHGASSHPSQDFSVRNWDTEDGLPGTAINALARTPDGYLWLGTGAGLVRFDGARFVTLTSKTTPALGDQRTSSLLADSKGVLWIVTQSGTLARRQAGAFVQVALDPRLRGVPINSLAPVRGVVSGSQPAAAA